VTTAEADPDTTRPVGRYEWENVMRRLSSREQISDELLLAALLLSTYADPDGTRVRPGEREFAEANRRSKPTARRRVAWLQEHGFVRLVSRGGGTGVHARASEYRLTLPVDLLEQFDVRPPGVATRRHMTVVTPLNQNERSSTQNSAQPRVSAVPDESPVDNSRTQLTHGERSSPETVTELRSNNDVSKRNSAQIGTELRSPMGERPPTTTPTTKATTTGPDPTQPDTADCIQNREPDLPAAVQLGPRRCPHGLSRARRDDGTPRCPACRRGLPAGKDPT